MTAGTVRAPEVADEDIVLRTVGLTKRFDVQLKGGRGKAQIRAVEDVSLVVERGKTLAIVGESGSGKTTLGRLILRLETPTSGDIEFQGNSILDAPRRTSRTLRQQIQIILQDPYSTLNPYQSVRKSVAEVLAVHHRGERGAQYEEAAHLLSLVGLPTSLIDAKPAQLSGGGLQRASIARALAVQPTLIVADEPVSALDVSVQAQVLNLFQELQRTLGLTYVFITHDLAVVRRLSDRVAVMYLGQVVEEGPAEEIFDTPLHPYTQALLQAAPAIGKPRRTAVAAVGEMPNPIDPPQGCPFHPRCPKVMDVCRRTSPLLRQMGPARTVSCHLYPDHMDPRTGQPRTPASPQQ